MDDSRAGESFLEAIAAGDSLRVRHIWTLNPEVLAFADRFGRSGLMVAVDARHAEVVKILLESGANPHHKFPVDGMHALHVFAEQDSHSKEAGSKEILRLLLDAGVDPNVSTTSGETVLHLVCLRGNVEAVSELFSRRLITNIDAPNVHGDTALHYASRKGNREIVQLLLAQGASPAIKGHFGTPAQVAAEFRQSEVVKLLRSLAHDEGPQLGLWSLPPEIIVNVLSFVANPRDLCLVGMTCRALATISAEDTLWRGLGHHSWAHHHVREAGGWKGAYMKWLRAAITNFRSRKNATPTPAKAAAVAVDHAYLAKVVMLGASMVGKTSFLNRYIMGNFSYDCMASIGATFHHRITTWNGVRIKLQLWDLSGPERFHSVAPMYYRGAHGALLVYDITDESSFSTTRRFMEDLRDKGPEDVSVVLVGNKSDLARPRAVTQDEGRKRAEEWGVRFCECSAKTGEGVDDVVELLVETMMGGWQRVAGMATPVYVPPEAFFTRAVAASTNEGHSGAPPPPASEQRCVLQ